MTMLLWPLRLDEIDLLKASSNAKRAFFCQQQQQQQQQHNSRIAVLSALAASDAQQQHSLIFSYQHTRPVPTASPSTKLGLAGSHAQARARPQILTTSAKAGLPCGLISASGRAPKGQKVECVVPQALAPTQTSAGTQALEKCASSCGCLHRNCRPNRRAPGTQRLKAL